MRGLNIFPLHVFCYTILMKKYVILCITLSILIFGLYFYFIGIKNIQTSVSVKDGKSYITKMYSDYSIVGDSCQGEDTNADSYVSCDFRIKNTAEGEQILHLQCPTILKSFTGSICKEYRTSSSQ
jgi:hypothetical protein